MANIIKISVGLAISLSVAVGLQHFTASPVILQASYDSVAGSGDWLELRANGTFDYTSASLFSETITRGRYTRTDSLVQLDQLPQPGVLKYKVLRVSSSTAFETGKGMWQIGPTGRIDSTASRLRIIYPQ